MTIQELLEYKVEEETNDLSILKGVYYNHIPEVSEMFPYGMNNGREAIRLINQNNTKIVIKYYKNFSFDGRRIWILASVWFENIPIMIIQNAGREGDDHARRFVINAEHYLRMCNYINSLIPVPNLLEDTVKNLISLDEEVGRHLTEFYGNSLDCGFMTYSEQDSYEED